MSTIAAARWAAVSEYVPVGPAYETPLRNASADVIVASMQGLLEFARFSFAPSNWAARHATAFCALAVALLQLLPLKTASAFAMVSTA